MRSNAKFPVLALVALVLLISGFWDAALSSAQDLPQIDRMDPVEVTRGSAIMFTGSKFPVDPKKIQILLNGKEAGTAMYVNSERTVFVYSAPSNKSLGTYNVSVVFKIGEGMELPVSSKIPGNNSLTINSESGKLQPKISGIYPLFSYPERKVYGFDVLGEGFSTNWSDNGLFIENRGEIPVCWDEDSSCDHKDPNAVHGKIISDRQLTFRGISSKYQGVNSIQVRVGQTYSNSVPITLSRVERGMPLLLSAVVFGVLVILVIGLTGRGVGEEIAGRKYGLIKAFLLDRETDTYSLSRFQFFVWTSVAIFSYLYLALSRSLVQGKIEFVDVPSGLPAIILVSASSSFLAQGITSWKGSKGAGQRHPALSDLITSGGVLAPERFQFFVWTLLGVVAFLALVVLQEPETIKDLPKVPSGFLELMGVSSIGYLGGKLARKAGPIIQEIIARSGSLEFTIRGRNLSQDAVFTIGKDEITSDKLMGGKASIVEKDEQSNDPSVGKALRLVVREPKAEWVVENELTIANPDGQKATWPYKVREVKNPVITSVEPADAKAGQDTTIIIRGSSFECDATAGITVPAGIPAPEEPAITVVSANEIHVTVNMPGPAPYKAELLVNNFGQKKAGATINVS